MSSCGPTELYVSRLSFCVMQDLKDLMRKAGDVTYADAHKDRRNEGYVSIFERAGVRVLSYINWLIIFLPTNEKPSSFSLSTNDKPPYIQ